MSEPRTLTIVQEGYNYTEAAYLDGVLVAAEDTLYACELTQAADGKPVVLVFRNVEWEDEWPENLSDLPHDDAEN
jgi:hypothetical protein